MECKLQTSTDEDNSTQEDVKLESGKQVMDEKINRKSTRYLKQKEFINNQFYNHIIKMQPNHHRRPSKKTTSNDSGPRNTDIENIIHMTDKDFSDLPKKAAANRYTWRRALLPPKNMVNKRSKK